jgi:Thioredoxin-like
MLHGNHYLAAAPIGVILFFLWHNRSTDQVNSKWNSLVSVMAAVALLSVAAVSRAETPFPPTDSYEQIFSSMEQAREKARADGKLLMYVMGANWCHDSTDFVEKTAAPEMSALIEQRYVLQLINVGNLEFIREVITRFDEPVIYGTPTVLIVEPQGNTLLNADSLDYWRSSSEYEDQDAIDYFSPYQPGIAAVPPLAYTPKVAAAMAEIDAFEAAQAERIYLAYADLGEAFEKMGKDLDEEAKAKWKQLAQMRSSITADLDTLRDEVKSQAKAGRDPITLAYPSYTLWIDE